MSTIQSTRDELATVLAPLGQVYSYLPGSAELPALVVGLPQRLNNSVSGAYWRVEIPIYVVVRSAVPAAAEAELLELVVAAVGLLEQNRTGTTYSSMRVVDTSDLYPITVGRIEAHSAQINTELMLTPTT